jgi:hypothetical protein
VRRARRQISRIGRTRFVNRSMMVMPTPPNRPMPANSAGASSGYGLADHRPGVSAGRDQRQHLPIAARLHAVTPADLQFPGNDQMHGDAGQVVVAREQSDLP